VRLIQPKLDLSTDKVSTVANMFLELPVRISFH